jgi:hypothetical protein
LRRSALVLAAALASLVPASCNVASPTLDSAGTSKQISSQLEAQYQVKAPTVSCPSGVRDVSGQTFACTATLDDQVLHLQGTVTSSGHFTVAPEEAVIVVSQRSAQLTQEIEHQAHTSATVDCGSRTLLVVPVGHAFPCTVTFHGEGTRSVSVKVVDVQGDFSYTVAPAK